MDKDKLDRNFKIVDEHFWFTAITVGFNSFIIEKVKGVNDFILIAVIVINIYAIFLILHRAAAHAERLNYPTWINKMKEKDKKFYHKGFETLIHLWTSLKMIPIVIFELSGALFYILLIVVSFLGVFFIR